MSTLQARFMEPRDTQKLGRPVRPLHQLCPLSRTAALQAGFQVGEVFGLHLDKDSVQLPSL